MMTDPSADLMIDYRTALDALQKAMVGAADPALSAMERVERVKGLQPLWAQHDPLRQKIEAIYR